jgi:hypothetical protein
MSDLDRASVGLFEGWPFFDASAQYLGPLPHGCPLAATRTSSSASVKVGLGSKTSGSASYHAGMCMWLASRMVRSFFPLKRGLIVEAFSKVAAGSPASVLEKAADSSSALAFPSPAGVEESEVDAEQLAEAASAGRQNLGSPLSTFWVGAKGELQEGFGRCSPGRWHPSTRGLTMKTEEAAFCKPLPAVVDKQVAILFPDSQRSVIALALGKMESQPFSVAQLQALRQDLFDLLPDRAQAAMVPDYLLFFLFAMTQTLRASGFG